MCIFLVIFLVSLIFPPGGWKIGKGILRFPDPRIWKRWDEPKPEYKDINNIISSVDAGDEVADSSSSTPSVEADTAYVAADAPQDMLSATVSIDSVYTGTYSFEFPEGQDTLLYPFFRLTRTLTRRNKPVRILHYGDSQIEGDRISGTIRNYMQRNFGGLGVGFIQVVPIANTSKMFQKDIPDRWKRISILDRGKDTLTRGRFGIAGALSRYVQSGDGDTVTHIGLGPANYGYSKARSFTHVRLFYGNAAGRVSAVINQTDTQQLVAGETVSSAWWKFGEPQQTFHLSLYAQTFPDVYGIALDGAYGVAVDNIPMRGSSGLDFARMDTEQMKQMFRMTDVRMLILQFGANTVVGASGSYASYGARLTRQLNMLKSLAPELTVIVIGVGDISQHTSEGYVSYPAVTSIRDAQRKAAFDAGCVFWDLLEAMGGENSMPAWVFADPPLAQKDFVHFSQQGAKIIGELFCRAWAKEYRAFTNVQ
ncbi:MAG: GDSL-type esterase/lipase family protein [Bacteroidales bacterium]|nr:GDSL-type esterase/lipase family protein [Bacteroidales bacterium]